MSISNSDIYFYWTNIGNGQPTTIPALSIGGYPSTTAVVFNNLFDNRLSDSFSEYRCIAIQNTNATYTAKNVRVYLKTPSANPLGIVNIAIERPLGDAYLGGSCTNVTLGTTLTIQDTTLSLPSNSLIGGILTVTSGLNINVQRTVISNDAPSHMIIVNSSFPFPFTVGDSYTVSSGPAQRLISGTIPPATNTSTVTPFSCPTSPNTAIGINVGGTRLHGGDLQPQDVIYVWFQRQLSPNAPAFNNNEIVLAVQYSTV